MSSVARSSASIAFAVALAVAPAAADVTAPQSWCAPGSGVQAVAHAGEQWAVVPVQFAPTESQTAVAHAVAPLDPSVWFATNGRSVVRTENAGCSWSTVYTLPTLPGPEAAIIHLAASDHGERVYVLAETGVTDAAGQNASSIPTFLVGTDSGVSWKEATGLPPLMRKQRRAPEERRPAGTSTCRWIGGCALAIAPSDPDRLYLTLPNATSGLGSAPLWTSDDGGLTWQPRPVPFDPITTPHIPVPAGTEALAVDPADADTLWAFPYGSQVHRSTDAGMTWTSLEPRGSFVLAAAAHRTKGQPEAQVTFAKGWYLTDPAEVFGIHLSSDGGRSWDQRAVDGLGGRPIDSVAWGADPDAIVMASGQDVLRHDLARGEFRVVDRPALPGAPPLTQAQATRLDQPTFHFIAGAHLLVWCADATGSGPAPYCPPTS